VRTRARHFRTIQTAATTSKKPISDLTTEYKNLLGSVDLTRVSLDEVNRAFIAYQTTVARLQGFTLSNWFAKLGDSISAFLSGPEQNSRTRLTA